MTDSLTHNFYFIRYPLGAGGVHLGHLVSLSDQIAPHGTLSKDRYFEFLYSEYKQKKTTVHLLDQCIISDPQWLDNLSLWYNYSGSVHTGHSASFEWAINKLNHFKNKKYILLQFNSAESRRILSQRELRIFKTNTLANSYYANEICHWYNTWFIEPDIISDDINLPMELSCVFDNDITPMIEKINIKYQLDIPLDRAQELHDIWINNIA